MYQAHADTITADEYRQAVREFLADSREWAGLEPTTFYTSDLGGHWRTSCDNAHGGLDVSWSFWATRDRGEYYDPPIATLETLTDVQIDAEFERLMTEWREAVAENS